MRLVNSKYNLDISIIENVVNVIVIEKPETLAEFVGELLVQFQDKDGNNIISDSGDIIKLQKYAKLIINPFELDYNDRIIQKKLFEEISGIVREKFIEETYNMHGEILSFLDRILYEVPYNVVYNDEENIIGLLKLYGVEIEKNENTILEKIVNYIKVLARLCRINIIFLVNIKTYLNEEELVKLYEFVNYEKVHLILIESTYRKLERKIVYEKCCIIDKDYCIINID